MKRTQVYLTQELYGQIRTMARLKDLPMAKIIRETLQAGLKNQKSGRSDLLLLTRLKIKGGPKDLSLRMDKYLYG